MQVTDRLPRDCSPAACRTVVVARFLLGLSLATNVGVLCGVLAAITFGTTTIGLHAIVVLATLLSVLIWRACTG